jgi:hypothetical protein
MNDSLSPTQVDNDVVISFESTNDSSYHFKLTIFVLIVNILAFRIPDALNYHLLGSLGSNSAKPPTMGF